MISVREYSEVDAEVVGRLIADTYSQSNHTYLPVEERGPYLGSFKFAYSPDSVHKSAIAGVIRVVVVLVAENEGDEIVGVLRGKQSRLLPDTRMSGGNPQICISRHIG